MWRPAVRRASRDPERGDLVWALHWGGAAGAPLLFGWGKGEMGRAGDHHRPLYRGEEGPGDGIPGAPAGSASFRAVGGAPLPTAQPSRARKRSRSATSSLLPTKKGTRSCSARGSTSSTRRVPVVAAPPAASAMNASGAHS